MNDPAATLEIPEEEDVEYVIEALEDAYNGVQQEYERLPPEDMSEEAARLGSLCQELVAQLSNQGYSQYE